MKKFTVGLAIAGAILAGCASRSERRELELQTRIAQEPSADTPEKIAERAAETFASAPGVGPKAKARLMEIYLRTYRDSLAIRAEIGKSKSLLFRTVAARGYSSADVEDLKAKIVALDQRRLQLMFKALTDVQDVVGYGREAEPLYLHFYEHEFPGTSRRSEGP